MLRDATRLTHAELSKHAVDAVSPSCDGPRARSKVLRARAQAQSGYWALTSTAFLCSLSISWSTGCWPRM